jgi:hypothetical protein
VKAIIEPFKIKMVEPIKVTTPAEREALLRRAHFNVFQLPAEEVMIDLLTDTCGSSCAACASSRSPPPCGTSPPGSRNCSGGAGPDALGGGGC